MARVADFRVVNDENRRLEAGQKLHRVCEIPPNLAHQGTDPQSVVFVKFNLEGASGLTWELRINGSLVLTTSGSGSDLITTMEAFDASVLLTGENHFEFRVTKGLGAVKVEDVTVHYHVEV